LIGGGEKGDIGFLLVGHAVPRNPNGSVQTLRLTLLFFKGISRRTLIRDMLFDLVFDLGSDFTKETAHGGLSFCLLACRINEESKSLSWFVANPLLCFADGFLA